MKIIRLIAITFLIIFWLSFLFRIINNNTLSTPLIYRYYTTHRILKGDFPLWLPEEGCGYPLFASSETGVLYPLNLIFKFSPEIASQLFISFHILLAFFFMFILAGSFNLKRFPALVSGLTFVTSGFFLTSLNHPTLIPYIWFPLLIYWTRKILKEQKLFYVALLSLTFFILYISGPLSSGLRILLFWLFYIFFATFTSFNRSSVALLEKLKKLSLLFIGGILGIGISAIQILPYIEFVKESVISQIDYYQATKNSLSLLEFSGLCWPVNNIGFLNIFSFFFLILGIFYIRKREERYLIYLLFLSLFFSLGKYSLIYHLLLYLPKGIFTQSPSDFLFFFTFFASLICGLGIKYFETSNLSLKILKNSFYAIFIITFVLFTTQFAQTEEFFFFDDTYKELFFLLGKDYHIFLILLILNFAIIFLYLKNRISSHFFPFISLIIIGINLLPWFINSAYFEEKNLGRVDLSFINKEEGNQKSYRLYLLGEEKNFLNPISSSKPQLFNCSFPLLTRFANYRDRLNKRLIDLANIKYIKTSAEIKKGLKLISQRAQINIYENPDYFPRTFLVGGAEKVEDRGEFWARLLSEDYDLRSTLLIEDGEKIENSSYSLDNFHNSIKVLSYHDEEIKITVNLNQPCYLFLSDTYYPGWKVIISGKEEKVLVANYLFRAVKLNSGKQSIRFVFKPKSFYLGIYISLFCFLLLIIFLISRIPLPSEERKVQIAKSISRKTRRD